MIGWLGRKIGKWDGVDLNRTSFYWILYTDFVIGELGCVVVGFRERRCFGLSLQVYENLGLFEKRKEIIEAFKGEFI